jgi:ribonuclease P protein component
MRIREVYTPLRRTAEFRRVAAQGRRKADARLQMRVLPTPNAPASTPLRLGIVASKRYGPAVIRNRFKRVVRAAMRALAPEVLPGYDLVITPREARELTLTEAVASLRALCGALGVLAPPPPGDFHA